MSEQAIHVAVEEWRQIPEWEGVYEASSLGRIRRIARGPSTQPGHILAPQPTGRGYLQVSLSKGKKKKNLKVSRLVAAAFFGHRVDVHQIDHINGCRTDNRADNLRVATQPENSRNRKPNANNTLKVKGVSFHKRSKRYVARIQINKCRINLGEFRSVEDAVAAYDAAAIRHHGEFARTNAGDEP